LFVPPPYADGSQTSSTHLRALGSAIVKALAVQSTVIE
jgi:hypothetical protein